MRSPRDRLVVKLLSGVVLALGCSRLTSVDWSRIPADDGEGGAGATDSGGSSGQSAGGSSISGGGGDAGAPVGGEGGDGGDSGGSSSGSGGMSGAAGFGGFGGFSGSGGNGGTSGSGGSSGNGGIAGSAGTGGGLSNDPDPCTRTTSPVVAADLVLFDGGHGKANTAWGGRDGLDAACAAALAKLSLPQTKTHAFITVSGTDSIPRWAVVGGFYEDISATSRVVGPTGIQLAPNFATLIGGVPLDQSLACAAVTSATDRTWLTGGWTCTSNPPVTCFLYVDGRDNCNGWTVSTYEPEVQARYGYTIYKDSRWYQGDSFTSPFAKVACNAATDNVLCMAYTPN